MKQKCQVEIKFKRHMSKFDVFVWVSVKWFNQSVFFMMKIKDGGVLNFSFFTINHFVYACMAMERGYVPKSTVAYSQGGMVKCFSFLCVRK